MLGVAAAPAAERSTPPVEAYRTALFPEVNQRDAVRHVAGLIRCEGWREGTDQAD